MRREQLVRWVAATLANQKLAHPTRVAVTGIDAAGKTTLADELTREIEALGRTAVRASIDDFHRPGHRDRSASGDFTVESYYDEAYDYEALVERLLDPLGPGGDRRVQLRYWQAYSDEPGPSETLRVGEDAIVVVDGIFLLRPELRHHWDLVVWIEIDLATALTRALERDIAWVKSADVVRERYESRNFPAHDLSVDRTGGAAAADIVIDNTNPHRPVLLRPTATTF